MPPVIFEKGLYVSLKRIQILINNLSFQNFHKIIGNQPFTAPETTPSIMYF